MPKTKILIALLLMIAILSLIIGCPVSSDDDDDDPTTVDKTAPTLATSGHSAKDQTVTVTFSENIKLGTAGQNAISITGSAITEVAISAKVLTITVETVLVEGTKIKVTFGENAIADTAGNALVAGDSPEITVAAATDTTPPTVVSSEAVAGSNTVTLTFSENIAFGSGANSNNNPVDGITIANNTVTNAIITNADLTLTVQTAIGAAGGTVTVTFVANAITDTATTPNAFAAGDASVTITAAPDTTPPTVVSSATTGGSTSVTLTFSEAIAFGTGGKNDGTGFTITGLTSYAVSTAVIADTVLTLTLDKALPNTGTFKVAFATNAITDKAATPNAFAGADSGDITITAGAPTAGANTPTTTSTDVISIYGDTFTEVNGVDINPNWQQTTTTTEETVGSDKVIKMANLDYQGLEFSAQNISCLDKVHLDYWTADATQFDVFMVSTGAESKYTVLSATTGSWTSLDIDISHYTSANVALDPYTIFQFKFDAQPAANKPTIYWDNIYFYSSTGGGTACPAKPSSAEPTAGPTAPTYDAANVISLFSDVAGYTALTGTNWKAGWSKGELTETTAGTDNVKKYSPFDIIGIEPAANLDIATPAMTHISFDLWIPGDITPDTDVFRIKLVDYGADRAYDGGDDVEHEITYNSASTPALVKETWINFNIPLTDFTGLTTMGSLQQIVLSNGDGAITTVYIDNLLFHK